MLTLSRIQEIAAMIPGPVVVFTAGSPRKCLYCSPSAPALAGYAPGDFSAPGDQDALSLVMEQDRPRIAAAVQKCTPGGDDVQDYFRLFHKTRGFVWVNGQARNIGVLDHQPVILATLNALSPESDAHDVLIDASNRMVAVVENSYHTLLTINETFCRELGIAKQDALDKKCAVFFKCPDCQNDDSCFLAAFLSESPGKHYTDPATKRTFSGEAHAINWYGRSATAFYFSDITLQHEMELIFQQHLNSIIQSNPQTVTTCRCNLTQNKVENSFSIYGDLRDMKNFDNFDQFIGQAADFIDRPEDRVSFLDTFNRQNLIAAFQQGQMTFKVVHSFTHHHTDQRLLRTTADILRNPYSRDIECFLYTLDITEQYLDQEINTLLLREEFESIGVLNGISGYFSLRRFVHRDSNPCEETRDQYDVIRQTACRDTVVPEDHAYFMEKTDLITVKRELERQEYYTFTLRSRTREGRTLLKQYSFYTMNRERQIILVATTDVTPMLERDILTGELSRAGFAYTVSSLLRNSSPYEQFVILYYNIRSFKTINDLFGNASGDQVLRQSAGILKQSRLAPLAVARMEADHFVCLIRREKLFYDELERLSQRSYHQNGKTYRFYWRCGIYIITDKSVPVNLMCDRAKLAKEYIRDDYVKPYMLYNTTMHEDFVSKNRLTSELKQALANREFRVYYQPIYNPLTGQIASAEALIRWLHPRYGIVSPGKFVPVFEENGYISELDLYVCKTVRAFARNRIQKKLPIVPIAVNLSRMDLFDTKMMSVLLKMLQTRVLPRSFARFEVTESSYTSLMEGSNAILSELKSRGAKLLIDDFGTGYSSFSTLQNFDFDFIKLDMSFVQKIGTSQKTEWIIHAIIKIAHHLGAQVIAEGVETKAQLDFLIEQQCDFIQGYYYSRPLPQAEFEQLLVDQ